MADIDSSENEDILRLARHNARQAGYVQNAQMMLMAAGLAAFGIVVVAATMITALL